MARGIVVLGSRGMAGQGFYKYFIQRDFDVLGISRGGADINLDLINHYDELEDVFRSFKPAIVINCVALVSLKACQDNPTTSFQVNSLLPRKLSVSAELHGFKLIHISTDHYYLLKHSPVLHSESDPVFLINNYSKSKYLGELGAASYAKSLIIRTNITGFRNDANRPTFIEWLIDSMQKPEPIKLFSDFYTSTIDVTAFCHFVYLLAEQDCSGLFNIASSESISKLQFAALVAKQMSLDCFKFVESNVSELHPRRASDLGLDCSKVESMLDLNMPSSTDVVRSLVQEYETL